jgi:hypothetical protein
MRNDYKSFVAEAEGIRQLKDNNQDWMMLLKRVLSS